MTLLAHAIERQRPRITPVWGAIFRRELEDRLAHLIDSGIDLATRLDATRLAAAAELLTLFEDPAPERAGVSANFGYVGGLDLAAQLELLYLLRDAKIPRAPYVPE